MAHVVKSKYDKYWANIDNINILLFVALVLDPRHKLDYVEWFIKTNYNERSANVLFLKIKVALRSIFELYASSLPQSKRKWKDQVVIVLFQHQVSLVMRGDGCDLTIEYEV